MPRARGSQTADPIVLPHSASCASCKSSCAAQQIQLSLPTQPAVPSCRSSCAIPQIQLCPPVRSSCVIQQIFLCLPTQTAVLYHRSSCAILQIQLCWLCRYLAPSQHAPHGKNEANLLAPPGINLLQLVENKQAGCYDTFSEINWGERSLTFGGRFATIG